MKKPWVWKLIRWFLVIIVLIGVGIYIFLSSGSPVTNNLHTYIYSLPFKPGTKHKVVQGYGGLFSHKNIAAIDFSMPEGTPVYAAREGNIYAYRDNNKEGGLSPNYKNKANYLIIQHNDGSFGCYWHLKKNGVVTKNGSVVRGQLIGYSGSTGFVLRPHLHFSVKQKLNYQKDSFVRTKFKTSNGIEQLKYGGYYERPSD